MSLLLYNLCQRAVLSVEVQYSISDRVVHWLASSGPTFCGGAQEESHRNIDISSRDWFMQTDEMHLQMQTSLCLAILLMKGLLALLVYCRV